MKRHSVSPAIIEKPVKATVKYNLTYTRMNITKKDSNKCWHGCENINPHMTVTLETGCSLKGELWNSLSHNPAISPLINYTAESKENLYAPTTST